MLNETIASIVDNYLQREIDLEGNKHPGKIDNLMADPTQDINEEWRRWFPINSTVTGGEIAAIEIQLGHKLPSEYVLFLKYKHFYKLNISEASFCKHPVNTWITEFNKMIYSGYPKEYLIDRGLIPFAGVIGAFYVLIQMIKNLMMIFQ
jgi:hypothetical protein